MIHDSAYVYYVNNLINTIYSIKTPLTARLIPDHANCAAGIDHQHLRLSPIGDQIAAAHIASHRQSTAGRWHGQTAGAVARLLCRGMGLHIGLGPLQLAVAASDVFRFHFNSHNRIPTNLTKFDLTYFVRVCVCVGRLAIFGADYFCVLLASGWRTCASILSNRMFSGSAILANGAATITVRVGKTD